MKLTKEQFKREIIYFFKKNTGLTITEAKNKIKKQMLTSPYQNEIKTGNVKLFYTNNNNYCGGIKNGYGKGWYITNQEMRGGTTIKL